MVTTLICSRMLMYGIIVTSSTLISLTDMKLDNNKMNPADYRSYVIYYTSNNKGTNRRVGLSTLDGKYLLSYLLIFRQDCHGGGAVVIVTYAWPYE